jgi:aminomuconate-semialdehyde/2-hydroxymuconate-6-semialdehyde dehydrogenase
MKELANYIGGALVPAAGGSLLENVDPALGRVYSKVPDSDARDVEQSVLAAERAFPAWAASSHAERGAALRRLAEVVRERFEEFVRAESVDTGKPVSLARALDIPRAIQNLEFFADASTQYATESHLEGGVLNYTARAPLGVVGCISPWNLPLYLLTWKIAPALAAGNCVVAKPSEVTPMTAYLLAQACLEANFPAGVLNLVQGTGPKVGAALCEHPRVNAVSFTGSTRVGQEIARQLAPRFKKVSLEMGGKNPNVVFADCDFDQAVATTVRSSFWNQGQICLCGSRIYVERPLYERFKAALVEKTRTLRQGDPLDPATEQGALVSSAHLAKVMGYLELAKKEGARVLTGGGRVQVDGRCKEGYFVAPTLLEGLAQSSACNQEEIFGPVATLTPFDSEEEVLGYANGTRYGLAASVWTRDLARAHRFSQGLKSGIVWVNCWLQRDLRTPFGGVKDSGLGREGGQDVYRFFTEPKNVCVKVG